MPARSGSAGMEWNGRDNINYNSTRRDKNSTRADTNSTRADKNSIRAVDHKASRAVDHKADRAVDHKGDIHTTGGTRTSRENIDKNKIDKNMIDKNKMNKNTRYRSWSASDKNKDKNKNTRIYNKKEEDLHKASTSIMADVDGIHSTTENRKAVLLL